MYDFHVKLVPNEVVKILKRSLSEGLLYIVLDITPLRHLYSSSWLQYKPLKYFVNVKLYVNFIDCVILINSGDE